MTSILFAATAVRIFAGAELLPTSAPLPFYVYPIFVATIVGWIVTLWRSDERGARAARE